MFKYLALFTAVTLGFGTQPGYAQTTSGTQSAVTAIDIALERMRRCSSTRRHSTRACGRVSPKGYALDASHRPHVTMLQRYVRTADLPKVYGAIDKIMSAKSPATWKLQAFKIDNAVCGRELRFTGVPTC